MIEIAARVDKRAARLRHLLAVHRDEAVHKHIGRRAIADKLKHRRPKQCVKIKNVFADEMVHLRLRIGF